MFEKRAECKGLTIQPLNAPVFDKNNFLVSQDLHIDEQEVQDTLSHIVTASTASINQDGDNQEPIKTFDLEAEIKDHPDSLFVKCFAIKADEMNDNGDYFSQVELIKATPTFVGVPVFTNHQNQDVNQARGKVVHSWWDGDKNGIMIIARVDAEAYPQLSRGIKEKYISGTSMGCVTPDCRVLMSNGTYLPIVDIQPGDEVITHLGNAKEVLNTQIRYKNEPIYEIGIEGFGSSLKITHKHPLLTLKSVELCACGCGEKLPEYKEGSKRAKSWKSRYRKRYINGHSQHIWNTNKKSKNHKISQKSEMQSKRQYSMDDFAWKNPSELSDKDVVVFPLSSQEIKNENITESHAKLIGYFLAEGSYKKYAGVRKEVNFSFCYTKERDTYVAEVIDLLKECFGQDISIWTQHRYPDNDVIILCCHNIKIAQWFYGFCGEYSTQKQLADEILLWPKNLQKHVLGCFINGDGCISTRNYINNEVLNPYTSTSLNTSSQKLAEQFSLILARNGIWHTFHASQNNKVMELKLCSGAERVSVTRTVKGKDHVFNVLPSYALVINQNYTTKLLDHFDRNGRKIFNVTNTFKDNDDLLIAGPYLCRKIKSIDSFVYNGPVYNLQVKDDNSYISEGITVKNCQVAYSICSACHNYAETPDSYCSCIRERKTRHIASKKQKCQYHKNGNEEQCPVCGSTKKDIKAFAYDGKAFEYNFGIKFIENSFVVNPACSSCGVEEVIDTSQFFAKLSHIQEVLPRLLKAAAEQPLICTDQSCIKIAGQQEIDLLNDALNQITSVSQAMLQQKDQIDLEFLSDLVKVLSDLQTVTDELIQQGYGRLESPTGQQPGTTGQMEQGPQVTNSVSEQAPAAPSKTQSGPAGAAGTVTGPLAEKELQLEKLAYNLLDLSKMIEHNNDTQDASRKLDLSFRLNNQKNTCRELDLFFFLGTDIN